MAPRLQHEQEHGGGDHREVGDGQRGQVDARGVDTLLGADVDDDHKHIADQPDESNHRQHHAAHRNIVSLKN